VKYYFLGICGTAMASLAILLKQKGHEVWGTDQNIYPPMSNLLRENQIEVWEGYDKKHLEKPFDITVIGNALTRGNPEIETLLNNRHRFASLPEIIRYEFALPKESIVITGTHGKTTTTALMSWMLEANNLSPTFLIGGVAQNFQTSARIGNGKYFVIEGDEYDCAFFDKRPKFIHYLPNYLIINNIEFDHADIYQDINQIKDGFHKLIRTLPENGLIIANGDDPNVRDVLREVYTPVTYFGKNSENDWHFGKTEGALNSNSFKVLFHSAEPVDFHLPYQGEHQIYNALSVIVLAKHLGISHDQIQQAFDSFQGVKRRLELWGELYGGLIYDDFAHHPTAIEKTLQALRRNHPDKKILAIFEPRTNTSVRNIFQRELIQALAVADISIILPLYRIDRISPENRLSISQVEEKLKQKGRDIYILTDYQKLRSLLAKILNKNVIGCILTNGNLGGEYEKLYDEILKNRK
jgi:UDP-N-acetylmuramate: L-alanyl-gamma-D-glutamyl-meso-diaminopimelate ligase